MTKELFYKDEVLDKLAEHHNVAQFVSYSPDGTQRFSRMADREPNHVFKDLDSAVAALMTVSGEGSLNVRTYYPGSPKSCPFHYGMKDIGEVVAKARGMMAEGLHIIINETIDEGDGGVSGIIQGGIMEYAPDCIPRFVEKADAPALPEALGRAIIETVYGIRIPDFGKGTRVEFSVHPAPRGVRQEQFIVWELGADESAIVPSVYWPNGLSRKIGDKAYGLVVASCLGLPVPKTTVLLRERKKAFSFGMNTGAGEDDVWTRTCPAVQTPGRFTTVHGRVDPFELMENDDPDGKAIPSCLVQQAVVPSFGGALVTGKDGVPILDGTAGSGDAFMQGETVEELPKEVVAKVMDAFMKARDLVGDCRFEWVIDRKGLVWFVQFHAGRTDSVGKVIHPGNPGAWIEYDPAGGIPALEALVRDIPDGHGVKVIKPVGMTSHVADVLRKAKIPSMIAA